jgi:glucose/arabinose dehydrogenase
MQRWLFTMVCWFGVLAGLQAQPVLLVTDVGDNNVYRFTGLAAGSTPTVFQNGIPGGVVMNTPVGIAQDSAGRVYVTATQGAFPNGQVLRFNGTTGAYIDRFVALGSGGLANPNGITFGPSNDLFVTDSSNSAVRRYAAATGAPVGTNGEFVTPGSGGLSLPYDVAWNSGQTFFFVSSLVTDQVLRYNSNGTFNNAFITGSTISSPNGIVFGPDGNLYVSMSDGANADRINRYNGTTGAFIDTFVSAGSGSLDGPGGLAFGPDGNLYVASQNNNSILRYNGSTGAFIDIYASGLGVPQELIFLSSAVPEPSTWALIVGTLAGFGYYYGSRHQSKKRSRKPAPETTTVVDPVSV